MKHTLRKISVKGLKDKIWKTVREAVLIRDGYRCQICGNFDNIQVDHCFSRRIKILFYDVRNLTSLCRNCHCVKSFQKGGATDKMVDAIVKNREGVKEWKDMMSLSRKTCPEFSTRHYLENQLELSEEKLSYWKIRKS